jgi:hypothetical protein
MSFGGSLPTFRYHIPLPSSWYKNKMSAENIGTGSWRGRAEQGLEGYEKRRTFF